MNDLQTKVKCDCCHKIFIKYKSQLKNVKKTYCSKECVSKSLTGEQYYVPCTCVTCGKSFKKYKNYDKSNINHFCSVECYNTFRKSNKSFGKGSRKIALKEYDHKCFCCGWRDIEDVLQVHHIDKNRENNTKENLIILCPTCHRIIHSGWGILVDRNLIILKEKLKTVDGGHISVDQQRDRLNDLKQEYDNNTLTDLKIFMKYAEKWNVTLVSSRKYIEKVKKYLTIGKTWEEILDIKINCKSRIKI